MTDYLTTKQAAHLIGYKSTSGITYAATTGNIEGHKNALGHWRLSRESVIAYGKRPKKSRRSHRINTAFSLPVGRAANKEYPGRWKTIEEQIAATMAGKVKPVYLDRTGNEI